MSFGAPSWGAVLGADDSAGPLPGSASAASDGVMMNALKQAAKCRDCTKTIDIGQPAWFNRDGESGRKITCQACHQQKVAAEADAAGEDDPAQAKTQKKASKKRKLTPELLCDTNKGITAMYKAFPHVRFKGKGHEAADLRRLLDKYREWGHTLLPEMEFGDLMEKVEKLKQNSRVRDRVNFVRSVQQGLCAIDDIDDYGLADYELGDGIPAVDENAGDDVGQALKACHGISQAQRERMERNRLEALARGAGAGNRGPAQGADAAGGEGEGDGPPPPEDEEEDYEAAWAAQMGGGFDEEEAAFALDAEAEMDFEDEEDFMAAAGVSVPPPAASAPTEQPAVAPTEHGAREESTAAAARPAPTEDVSPAEAEAQRARERAMAEAMALEEGLEEEEVPPPPPRAAAETQAWGPEESLEEEEVPPSRAAAETQAWGPEESLEEEVPPSRAAAETQAWGTNDNDDEDSEDEPIAAMAAPRAAAETQAWGATEDDEDSEDESIAAMAAA